MRFHEAFIRMDSTIPLHEFSMEIITMA